MPVSVLPCGAGEYICGYVPTTHGAASDKPAGVVAITCFDLRRFGKVGRMVLCDACGTKLPAVRQTMQNKIGDVYRGMDLTLECFPSDDIEFDADAIHKALATMSCGDVCIIFTPDDTHFALASAALSAGLHVLMAKPLVKTLQHHRQLVDLAAKEGVLLAVEYHKRFDPMYSDARNRIQGFGDFSYYSSYMSQPKQQLDTFKAWAGKSSDISYYLNSHHIDIMNWSVQAFAQPVRVVAMASRGIADEKLGRDCEDTITLMTQWRSTQDKTKLGTAVYTASWVTPKGDAHTQQHLHYMGSSGELRVDQAHRGYSQATDAAGYAALNVLYMRYTPDSNGYFAGQSGYGYQSIAQFIRAAADVNNQARSIANLRKEGVLALADTTLAVTAILEAGRLSLDAGGAAVSIQYGEDDNPCGLKVAC